MQNSHIPQPFDFAKALSQFLESSHFNWYGDQLRKFIKRPQCWEELLKIIDAETSQGLLDQSFKILETKLKLDILQISPIQLEDVSSQLKKYLRQSKYLKDKSLNYKVSRCVSLIIYHQKQQDLDLLEALDDWFDHEQILLCKYYALYYFLIIATDEKITITLDKKQEWKNYLKDIRKEVIDHLRGDQQEEIQSFQQDKLIAYIKCMSLWIAVQSKQDQQLSLHDHPIVIAAFQKAKNLIINEDIKEFIKQVIITAKVEQNKDLFNFIKPYIDQLINKFGAHGQLQQMLRNKVIYLIYFFLRSFRKQYLCALDQQITLFEPLCRYIQIMDNQSNWTDLTETYFVDFSCKFTRVLVNYPNNYSKYTDQVKHMVLILVDICKLSIGQCESLETLSKKQLSAQNNKFKLVNQNFKTSQFSYQNIIQILSPTEYVSFIRTQIEIANNLDMQQQQYECTIEAFIRCLLDYKLSSDNTLKLNHADIDILVEFFLQQEFQFKVLRSACLSFLSQVFPIYSSNDMVMSQKIIKHIFKCLDQGLRTEARKQIKNICVENKIYVLNHLNMFIQVFKKNKGSQLLIEGLITVLITDVQKLKQHLPQLEVMAQEYLKDPKNIKNLKVGLTAYQKIFQTIVTQNLPNTQNFLGQYFVKFWKNVRKIFKDQYQNRDLSPLIQKCAKITKYGLRALKSYAQLYLKQIFSVVIYCYSQRPLSSYVYLVQVFLTIYQNLKDSFQLLTQIFNQIIKYSFKHFKSQQNLGNDQLIEDFIGMINRSINFCPQILLNSQHLQNILKFIFKKQNINSKLMIRLQSFISDFYVQYCSTQVIQKWKGKPINSTKLSPQFTMSILQIKQKIKPIILKRTQKFIKNVLIVLQHHHNISLGKLSQALLYQVQAFPDQMKQLWNKIMKDIPQTIYIEQQKQSLIENIQLRKYLNVKDEIKLLLSRVTNCVKVKI